MKEAPVRILDTHLHLWDPRRLRYDWLDDELDRTFGPTQWREASGDDAPRASVFVQAECVPPDALAEVEWIAGLAPAADIVAIVGWAPLDDPDATGSLLESYSRIPLVAGIRRPLQDEAVDFSRTPEFREGCRAVAARGLVFDACVTPAQLAAVAELADAVPELTIVLDHLGKPAVGTADAPARPTDSTWAGDLRELAARPSVSCKLSGLPAQASGTWDAAQVEPFLDVALEAFGPSRLLFGSDWPVSARRPEDKLRWQRVVERWAIDRLGIEGASDVLWRAGAHRYAPALDRP